MGPLEDKEVRATTLRSMPVPDELYVLLARGVRPPPRTPHTPPLAAAQEPPGAPESLATGPLAHHPAHAGLVGWPWPQEWVSGGPGLRLDPEARTPSV